MEETGIPGRMGAAPAGLRVRGVGRSRDDPPAEVGETGRECAGASGEAGGSGLSATRREMEGVGLEVCEVGQRPPETWEG